MKKIIAVTGGIGSGKSIVCKILSKMGYDVYDCDLQAKELMDNDEEIKESLRSHIHADAVSPTGKIDRQCIAKIVFRDANKLNALNAIVHSGVKKDLANWLSKKEGLLFVETAILYQSGLNLYVDEAWEVTAPLDVRIERVKMRNNMSEEQVLERINSQARESENDSVPTIRIINDGNCSLLLQLNKLISLQ